MAAIITAAVRKSGPGKRSTTTTNTTEKKAGRKKGRRNTMHQDFWGQLGEALLMAAGMFWDVGWSLVLGFTISAVIQAVVSTEQMRRALGRDGVREMRWPRLPVR
jgi:uncharacterized membrane protein YraQ (UPF0718 family)